MKQNLIYIFALILLTVVGCDEREVDNFQNPDNGILTVTANAPAETPATRSVESPSNNKKIVVRFRKNEKIHLYFKQGSKLKEVKNVVFSNITNRGKTVQFKIKIPEGIQPNKDYTLYGVYGTDSRIKDGRPFASIKTKTDVLDEAGKSRMQIPLYFYWTVKPTEEPTVTFMHMGSILVYNLRNESNRELKNIKTPFLYAFDGYQNLPYFVGAKEANEEFSVDDGGIHSNPPNKFAYMLFLGKTRAEIRALRKTNSIKVVQWVAPKNFEGRLPATMFWYIRTKHKSYYSNVMRAPKMYRGRAYHIGLTYTEDANGNGRITATASAKTTPSHMTLTSNKNTIRLFIASRKDKKNVWIDLNGNSKKDSGEQVTDFRKHVTYKKTAKTITIYGNVGALKAQGNALTGISIKNNPGLTYLLVKDNLITDLDLSKSTELSFLNVQQNKLTKLDVSKIRKVKYVFCYRNNIEKLDLGKQNTLEALHCHYNKLKSLNVANGNNANVREFFAQGNPDLTCIQVDKGFTPPSKWKKDATTSWNNTGKPCK